MVYEDESNDLSSLLYFSSSDDGMQYQVPASIVDQDYMGIEKDPLVPCEQRGLAAERHVAFEGFETGRRFLMCPNKESHKCGFVQWVDPEWPPTLQNALLKLWEMYEDSRSDKTKDNLEKSLTIHHLTEEKNKLEGNYDKLVEDVHQLFNAQEERMVDFSYLNAKVKDAQVANSAVSDMKREMEKKDVEIFKLQEKYKVLMNLEEAQGNVIRNLKFNHMKEKQQLCESSMKLQLQVDELNKSQEKLTQGNSKLKLHIADLNKGHDKLTTGRAELKLQIADLLRTEQRNSQKLKGIEHILAE